MSFRSLASLATLLFCAACGGGDTVLAGRTYSPAIPRDAVLGLWAPVSRTPTLPYSLVGAKRPVGPETLAVRSDGACELSPALAQLLIECEHAYIVRAKATVPCGWRIEGTSEGESFRVQFQDAERQSRLAAFAAYRDQTGGDMALVWTCAVGDARGLFHQGTLVP